MMKNDRVQTLQNALDYIEKLPPEVQETLIEIINRRMVDRRREQIARNAKDTLNAVREKKRNMGQWKNQKETC